MERNTEPTERTLIGANPVPLGFAALGLTTGLFGTYLAGHAHTGLGFVAITLVFGGLVQLIASILAYRDRDTYGLTIFGTFGALWLGLGVLFAYNIVGTITTPLLSGDTSIWFWFAAAIVSTYVWLASVRVNGAVTLVTLLLAAMFWTLWIGDLTSGTPGNGWTAVSGWLGWATAIVAGYTSFAELINRTFGKMILPEFPMSEMQPMSR